MSGSTPPPSAVTDGAAGAPLLVRERFALDDRTFAVLAEPWYDPAADAWRGRWLYLSLDRALPHPLTAACARRARRRDPLVRALLHATDRELARALRALLPPPPRRA